MARLKYNGLRAVLNGNMTASLTTIQFQSALTASGGIQIPTIAAGDYLPLSVLDSTGNLSEVVYLTAYTAGATSGTVTRGQEGTSAVTHSAGDRVIYGATIADIGYEGNGSPEGNVAAGIGAFYTDGAATRGAIKWVKMSGTGGTGWRVYVGDTGYRNVTADLANSWTGGALYLRRTGDLVHAMAQSLNASAKTSTILYNVPAGFSLPNSITKNVADDTSTLRSLLLHGGNQQLSTPATGADVYFNAMWTTTAAWPNALPGSAASI